MSTPNLTYGPLFKAVYVSAMTLWGPRFNCACQCEPGFWLDDKVAKGIVPDDVVDTAIRHVYQQRALSDPLM